MMILQQQHDEHQTNGDIKLAFLSYNYLILHDDKAESNICFLWLPPDDKVEFYDPAAQCRAFFSQVWQSWS